MVQGSFSGLGRPGVNAKPEEDCQLFFDGVGVSVCVCVCVRVRVL
jgi:hypothetical protein